MEQAMSLGLATEDSVEFGLFEAVKAQGPVDNFSLIGDIKNNIDEVATILSTTSELLVVAEKYVASVVDMAKYGKSSQQLCNNGSGSSAEPVEFLPPTLPQSLDKEQKKVQKPLALFSAPGNTKTTKNAVMFTCKLLSDGKKCLYSCYNLAAFATHLKAVEHAGFPEVMKRRVFESVSSMDNVPLEYQRKKFYCGGSSFSLGPCFYGQDRLDVVKRHIKQVAHAEYCSLDGTYCTVCSVDLESHNEILKHLEGPCGMSAFGRRRVIVTKEA